MPCSCTGAPVEVYVLRKGVSWTNSATNIPAKCNSLEGLQSRDPEKHNPAGLRDNSCQVSVAVCKKSRTGIWTHLSLDSLKCESKSLGSFCHANEVLLLKD